MTDDQTEPRTTRQRLTDAVLHRGPGYDRTPDQAPSGEAATRATDLETRIREALGAHPGRGGERPRDPAP
jgi:hypothetical protein